MTWQISDLHLIHIISFLDLLAVGLIIPLIGNYLRDLGATHFTVGIFSSLYSGIQVFSGPLVGSWSDIRSRKSVLIITLIVCSICYILLGLTQSLFVIFLLRFTLGLVKQTQTLVRIIVTDLTSETDRVGIFGKLTALGSIGFIVGPLIGGHISELNDGFYYVCLLTGILFIVNIGFATRLEETKKKKSSDNRGLFVKIKKEFSKSVHEVTDIDWSAHWECFVLRFLHGFTMMMFFSNQAIYLKEYYGLSQRHIGYIISYFSAVGTISAFLIDQINKRFYKDDENCVQRLKHSYGLMTFTILGFYFSSGIELFLVFLIPFAVCSMLLRVVTMELMLKQSDKDHRGSIAGAAESIMSLSSFITPLMSGVISDIFGEHFTMLLTTMPPLIGTIICFKMKIKKNLTNKSPRMKKENKVPSNRTKND